jgi:hypothetical protein
MKDHVEHNYNFDDEDIDRYSEKVSNLFEKTKLQKGKQTVEDEDFIAMVEKPTAPNMQKVDLFGVALDALEGSDETLKDRNNKRKFVQELLQVMDSLDQESDPDGIGLAQDFSKGKTFMHFDPYTDMERNIIEAQYTALQYEDSMKLRASIVLNAYSN